MIFFTTNASSYFASRVEKGLELYYIWFKIHLMKFKKIIYKNLFQFDKLMLYIN